MLLWAVVYYGYYTDVAVLHTLTAMPTLNETCYFEASKLKSTE